MSLALDPTLARRLIGDPIMAAKVLMGAEFDVFQSARVRLSWFTPVVMDFSGVSTGKTEEVFILSFLRSILLPGGEVPRIACVYYQSKGTAQEVFLPKIEKYCSKSNVFYRQIKLQHGRKLYKDNEGNFIIEGRAGWKVELPAGNFMQEAKSQASRRFNDLFIDETGEIDKMGKGINKQLLQRNTLECFNPNHPILCNHTLFLGHAEEPGSPYHKRYTALKKQIRRGSQSHAVITSRYADYQGEYMKRFGQDIAKKADEQRKGDLDVAEAAQVLDGMWGRGNKGLYHKVLLDGIQRRDILPQFSRADDQTLYFFGGDFAPGRTDGTDLNTGIVTAATPIPLPDIVPGFDRLGLEEFAGQWWFIRPVFAYYLHSESVDILSGVIHLLHRAFGFSKIILDAQGGGAWAYKKLVESRQFIDNKWVNTHGLCQAEHSYLYPEAEPIIAFYDRGSPYFRPSLDRYVQDNSGPADFANREVRSAMSQGRLAWPAGKEMRGAVEMASMAPEMAEQIETLDAALKQFMNLALAVNKEGHPVISEAGFRKIVKRGKTDGAIGFINSYMGARVFLGQRPAQQQSDSVMGVFP